MRSNSNRKGIRSISWWYHIAMFIWIMGMKILKKKIVFSNTNTINTWYSWMGFLCSSGMYHDASNTWIKKWIKIWSFRILRCKCSSTCLICTKKRSNNWVVSRADLLWLMCHKCRTYLQKVLAPKTKNIWKALEPISVWDTKSMPCTPSLPFFLHINILEVK